MVPSLKYIQSKKKRSIALLQPYPLPGRKTKTATIPYGKEAYNCLRKKIT